jgi:transposase
MSPKGALLMILDTESWMNIRRFRALHAAGATFAEIGRECGCDWRTVRKYLAEDVASVPPAGPSRMGTQPLLITPFISLVEAWLRDAIDLKGTVIYERLVAEYGFAGHYQRVKMFLAETRPRITAELAERDENPVSGLHRRFEVIPGAQAQVDWGDEGDLLAHVGIPNVYSFHMVLSHSRDPFCCFTISMDLATFWDCHRRAFAHFGGVPGTIVYDRTKTVIRRHVAPGLTVPLHPEAAAFADITGSPSMCWPRIVRPGNVGSSGKSTSSGTMCSPAAASTPSASSTARSTPGCRSADPRCIAPTARSSPSGLELIGPA